MRTFGPKPFHLALLFVATNLFVHAPAHAIDAFEIQVYDTTINEPLQPSLEVHYNNVLEGRSVPEYPNEIPPDHLNHLTLEPALGITRYLEVGSYLQFVIDSHGEGHWAGAKLRTKWVVPEGTWEHWRLGVNLEVSRVPHPFEPDAWSTEVRPILGYEAGRWAYYVNPILGWSLSGGNGVPDFEPAAKIRWDTGFGFGIGIEYYGDIGQVNAVPPVSQQEHYLFVTGDLLNAPLELNFGVGYGLTSASNRWIMKLILGKALARPRPSP
ncbi:MAG TPA: hypothetical protein VKM54_19160 [Myxococcota bacterium]|nr:hypothetical protein [Myxococcota bacterium]